MSTEIPNWLTKPNTTGVDKQILERHGFDVASRADEFAFCQDGEIIDEVGEENVPEWNRRTEAWCRKNCTKGCQIANDKNEIPNANLYIKIRIELQKNI